VILCELAKYLLKRSVTRSLCESRASCYQYIWPIKSSSSIKKAF